jgi:hypothetical protein
MFRYLLCVQTVSHRDKLWYILKVTKSLATLTCDSLVAAGTLVVDDALSTSVGLAALVAAKALRLESGVPLRVHKGVRRAETNALSPYLLMGGGRSDLKWGYRHQVRAASSSSSTDASATSLRLRLYRLISGSTLWGPLRGHKGVRPADPNAPWPYHLVGRGWSVLKWAERHQVRGAWSSSSTDAYARIRCV